MKNERGFIIHEGVKNGHDFVVIATLKTNNRKTGDMIQIWILLTDVSPVDGVKTGVDALSVCTGCVFANGNGCYVNVGQAPLSIWKGFKRGLYETLPLAAYPIVFTGRKVRFGAYGNPSLIPLAKVKLITSLSDGWTGYFHDWKEMHSATANAYGRYFMASTETEESRCNAIDKGLRYFHVSPEQPEGTLECLADSQNLSCADCKLCQGNRLNAKPIWINPHGSKRSKAVNASTLN
jgi:hypothetical protein